MCKNRKKHTKYPLKQHNFFYDCVVFLFPPLSFGHENVRRTCGPLCPEQNFWLPPHPGAGAAEGGRQPLVPFRRIPHGIGPASGAVFPTGTCPVGVGFPGTGEDPKRRLPLPLPAGSGLSGAASRVSGTAPRPVSERDFLPYGNLRTSADGGLCGHTGPECLREGLV